MFEVWISNDHFGSQDGKFIGASQRFADPTIIDDAHISVETFRVQRAYDHIDHDHDNPHDTVNLAKQSCCCSRVYLTQRRLTQDQSRKHIHHKHHIIFISDIIECICKNKERGGGWGMMLRKT